MAASLVLVACPRGSKHPIDRVEVSLTPLAEVDMLPVREAQIREQLLEKLRANGHFDIAQPDQHNFREAPARLQLELSFVRQVRPEGSAHFDAEAGAVLVIRRTVGDVRSSYELDSIGRARISGESLDEKQVAARRALGSALDELVTSAALQLAALDKRDSDLGKDLRSRDVRVRQCAIRVLADRKNPAVEPALLEELKSCEIDSVRRAISGLVELKDARAVPALIDLGRGQDLNFLREIVFALGAIGGEEAEAYLYTVAQGHDDPEIRESAQQALRELRARHD